MEKFPTKELSRFNVPEDKNKSREFNRTQRHTIWYDSSHGQKDIDADRGELPVDTSSYIYRQMDTPAPPSSAKSLPLATRPIMSLLAPALPSLTLMLTSTFWKTC